VVYDWVVVLLLCDVRFVCMFGGLCIFCCVVLIGIWCLSGYMYV
jgi:hypothetical protein